jgi:hypothetical protein
MHIYKEMFNMFQIISHFANIYIDLKKSTLPVLIISLELATMEEVQPTSRHA